SNGNDAILTRDNIDIKGLKGKQISLVELSVSHYLLSRCLTMNGLKEKDVNLINTSDADIAPIFLSNSSQKVVVTWNPMVMQVEQAPGINKIFTSADIPGEVLDLMVVNTKTLQADPALGKALTGAWFEVLALISKRGPETDKALEFMASSAGCSAVEFKNQLKTTAMFWTPQAALDFTTSEEIRTKMEFVRQFCFDKGLLGEGSDSADIFGVSYPGGEVQGNKNKVRMRFDASFVKMAAEGSL
ncbi:MAG: ABC transporter substrate-binding protein, partial [Acidobacteria bacterium]|nr:ABC transporter substrate-binding protein [Acidobacteriota bacterium]